MITSRSYENISDSGDFCRRSSSRGMPLSVSHSLRDYSRYDPLEVTSNRLSPASDVDGKPGGGSRRRIAVACDRCRKRKIKCSGDSGNGNGCTACQSSGNPNCRFLRVNSSECMTIPEGRPGWPYGPTQAMTPSSLSHWSGAPGPIRSHGLSLVPSPNHYVRSNPSYYGGSFGRSGYSAFDDETTGIICTPSAYNVPGSESLQMTGMYSSGESPKPWTSTDTSYSNSTYSYTPSPLPAASTTATSGPSLFPVMNSAVPGLSNGRTLPEPVPARNHSSSGMPSSAEYASTLASGSTYKSPAHWTTDSVASGSSASDSTRTLSVDNTSSGAISSSKSSTTQAPMSGQAQDMGFGYMSISHSPTSVPIPSTSTYASSDATDSPSNAYCVSTLCRSDSRETITSVSPHLTSSTGDYSHTTNTNGKRNRGIADPGLLMSGERYVRPEQSNYAPNYRSADIAHVSGYPSQPVVTEVTSGGNY